MGVDVRIGVVGLAALGALGHAGTASAQEPLAPLPTPDPVPEAEATPAPQPQVTQEQVPLTSGQPAATTNVSAPPAPELPELESVEVAPAAVKPVATPAAKQLPAPVTVKPKPVAPPAAKQLPAPVAVKPKALATVKPAVQKAEPLPAPAQPSGPVKMADGTVRLGAREVRPGEFDYEYQASRAQQATPAVEPVPARQGLFTPQPSAITAILEQARRAAPTTAAPKPEPVAAKAPAWTAYDYARWALFGATPGQSMADVARNPTTAVVLAERKVDRSQEPLLHCHGGAFYGGVGGGAAYCANGVSDAVELEVGIGRGAELTSKVMPQVDQQKVSLESVQKLARGPYRATSGGEISCKDLWGGVCDSKLRGEIGGEFTTPAGKLAPSVKGSYNLNEGAFKLDSAQLKQPTGSSPNKDELSIGYKTALKVTIPTPVRTLTAQDQADRDTALDKAVPQPLAPAASGVAFPKLPSLFDKPLFSGSLGDPLPAVQLPGAQNPALDALFKPAVQKQTVPPKTKKPLVKVVPKKDVPAKQPAAAGKQGPCDGPQRSMLCVEQPAAKPPVKAASLQLLELEPVLPALFGP